MERHVTQALINMTLRDWNTKHSLALAVSTEGTCGLGWYCDSPMACFSERMFFFVAQRKRQRSCTSTLLLKVWWKTKSKRWKEQPLLPLRAEFHARPTAEWHLWRGPLGGQRNRGAKCKVLDSEKPCVILSLGHRGANFYCISWSSL